MTKVIVNFVNPSTKYGVEKTEVPVLSSNITKTIAYMRVEDDDGNPITARRLLLTADNKFILGEELING